ncbi:MAG: YdcF family protein [Methylococcales bacterium]
MSAVLNNIKHTTKLPVRWLQILLGCAILDIVFTVAFLAWSQYAMVLPNNIEADGAVLLFAGMSNQERIDESQRRINQVYDLYQRGTVKEILSAGGYGSGIRTNGAELYQRKLLAMGVPENSLSIEGLSYDTLTNINNALSIIEDKRWKRIIFVSSPTHLMRVKHYLKNRKMDIEVYYSSYDYLQSQPEPGLLTLWQRVHSEWAIYLMYNVMGQKQFSSLVRSIRLEPETIKV